MKLQVIQNKAFDRDIANVCQTAELLADLTVRAGITTSQDVQDKLEVTTHEAQAVAATVNLGAIEAGLNEAGRPATAQEIKRELQVLIGSFPNSGKNDLAIYGVALFKDVCEEKPGIAALTNACRFLRRTGKFVPTISEVLTTIAQETQRHEMALAGVRELPQRIEKALQAAVDLRERRAHDFGRMVRFCKSRIACQQSHDWFDAAVLTEARRQLGLNIDDATCNANRKRLAPMLAVQAMPKGDAPVGQHEIAPPASAVVMAVVGHSRMSTRCGKGIREVLKIPEMLGVS
jgi:hypothetical protein